MAAAECPELDRDRQRASTLRAVCAHVQLSWQEIWPLGFGTSGVRSRGKAVAPGPWVLGPCSRSCVSALLPGTPSLEQSLHCAAHGRGLTPDAPSPQEREDVAGTQWTPTTWFPAPSHPLGKWPDRVEHDLPPEGKESQFPGLEVVTVVKLTRLPFRLPPGWL